MLATYDQVIEQIAQSIFSTMLDAPLDRIYDLPPESSASLVGVIHIMGGWNGCVVLEFSPDMADFAASRLLAKELNMVSPEDRRDSASELVNMLGGNLKSLLPGPSRLSLPTVFSGGEVFIHSEDSNPIEDVVMIGEFGTLRIQLYVKRTSNENSVS